MCPALLLAPSPRQLNGSSTLSPFPPFHCSRAEERPKMAMASSAVAHRQPRGEGIHRVMCRKKDRDRDRDRDRDHHYPYKVVEITPPPRSLGVRCFPLTIHNGESVTIEGQAYTVSAVVHRYQLRKGKYEPCEKRLDVQSTGRYILNLYLENLLEKS